MKTKLKLNWYTIIKYTFSAGFCFLIDLGLFSLLNHFLKKSVGSTSIIISTIIARVFSTIINYNINKNRVFNASDVNNKIAFFKYISLVIFQMTISFTSVFIIYNLIKINESVIKFFVECILFVINYFIQKHLIFKKKY